MSLNFGKGSSQSASNQTSNQTSTPNNLPFLQQGWGAASDLLSGANPTATAGLNLTATGANAAGGAATGGLTTATNLANGGAANPANSYLTPFANGSMTGENNPYFANLTKQLAQALQGQTDGDFAASGRYGSGANANAFNSSLANEVGQLGFSDYNNSLDRQLNAGGQLSTNNTNSTNAALSALGLIPGLGTAATGAGSALYGAGVAPTATYADILQLLGQGGGTVNGTASGNTSGTQTAVGGSVGGSSTGGKSILDLLGL